MDGLEGFALRTTESFSYLPGERQDKAFWMAIKIQSDAIPMGAIEKRIVFLRPVKKVSSIQVRENILYGCKSWSFQKSYEKLISS